MISSMLGIDGGSSGFLIGLVLSILVGIVIIGGIKRIAKITEKIVLLWAGVYVSFFNYYFFKFYIYR